MRRSSALAIATVFGLLAVAALAGAAEAETVFETREFDAPGQDTVVFELTTTDGATTLDNSYLTFTAPYDESEERQRGAMITGLVQEASSEDCPADGGDACFMRMWAARYDDVAASTQPDGNGDLRIDTGPGADVSAETGHDHEHLRGLEYTLGLAHRTLPADAATDYHLFVSVPDAEGISGELSIVASGDLTVSQAATTDTGFTAWIDEMRAAGAHSPAANAYVSDALVCGPTCGSTSVDPGEGQRLFGAIGPTQASFYNVHSHPNGGYCTDCFGTIPAVFAGQWGYDTPDERRIMTGAGTVGQTSPRTSVATLPGFADHPGDIRDDGDVTFFVDRYVSAGPQDLVAGGFLTPADPVN